MAMKEGRNANDKRSKKQIKHVEDKQKFKKSGFSERVRKLLLDNGMTRKQLAEKIDTSQAQVTHWLDVNESGLPDIINLIQIAKTLNVSLDYLCGCEEKEEDNTKNKVQINSFNNLLSSFLEQYKYCVDNDIPYNLEKIRFLVDDEPLKQVYLNFIGIDINDRYVNDFMDKLLSFIELKNEGKLTDEQFSFITKSMPDAIAKERKNNIEKGEEDHTDPNHEEVITYDQENLPF